MVSLPVFRGFHVRVEFNACGCALGLYKHCNKTSCTESWLWENRTGESNPRQYRTWLFGGTLYKRSFYHRPLTHRRLRLPTQSLHPRVQIHFPHLYYLFTDMYNSFLKYKDTFAYMHTQQTKIVQLLLCLCQVWPCFYWFCNKKTFWGLKANACTGDSKRHTLDNEVFEKQTDLIQQDTRTVILVQVHPFTCTSKILTHKLYYGRVT